MADEEKIIYVYSDWIEPCSLMGKMYVNYSRGREVTAFEFDDNWLKANNSSICYDPDLSYYSGRQYAPLDKQLFGIFSDSCPDRWGRLLMKRREETYAKKEDRKPKKLTETDFLLGVYDQTRMGGLRFALSEGGQFLSADKDLAAPPWTTLRTLENASIAFENSDDSDNEKWLKQLIAPGSSLGGARPKASVLAPDGSLWIAKFPSKNDDMDVGAWEMVVHDLAELCAITVPPAKVESFSKYGSTFLVKRFDRNGERRIHFSSAMTLLGKKDGDDNVSYLDLVSFIKSNGVSPQKDLEELFKRLVFTVAVSNTDNHLRNHGFLLTERGWELSPMFDVNPNNAGYNLALNIDLNNNDLDIGLALSTAKYYNLPLAKAEKIANDIVGMVNDKWRQLATKYGLNRSQIERIAPVFTDRN